MLDVVACRFVSVKAVGASDDVPPGGPLDHTHQTFNTHPDHTSREPASSPPVSVTAGFKTFVNTPDRLTLGPSNPLAFEPTIKNLNTVRNPSGHLR